MSWSSCSIEFARSKDAIVMNHRKYAIELISEMRLSGSKPIQAPLYSSLKLTFIEYENYVNEIEGNWNDKPLEGVSKYFI